MISNLTEVPPNWIKVRFDEIAENITDRIDKPNESGLEYYIGLEHLDTDQIRIKRFGSTDDVNATKFLCKKADIIFGKRRSYLRKVAVTDRDAVVSAHSMVIRPKGDFIVPEFLPCFMQSSVFWKTAHAISEGSMSPTIKWKTLAKQEFWIPTIEEQKKIATVFWSIEDNAEKNGRLIKISETLKKELIIELLTKGLGHEKFKHTDVCDIPENWKLAKLSEIGEKKDSIVAGPFGSNLKVKDYVDKGVPIIRLQNINRNKFIEKDTKYISKEKADELTYHSYEDGDIVLAKLGDPVGKTCEVPEFMKNGIVTSDVVRIRVSPNKANKKFIEYMLNSPFCHDQLAVGTIGSTRPRVNLSDVRNLDIFLPPLSEQDDIAKIFQKLDENIEKYQNHRGNIELLKKKLINDYLSGKLIIPKEVL